MREQQWSMRACDVRQACVCVHERACMCAGASMCASARMCSRVRSCVCVRACVHARGVCVCMRAPCMCVCVCVCVFVLNAGGKEGCVRACAHACVGARVSLCPPARAREERNLPWPYCARRTPRPRLQTLPNLAGAPACCLRRRAHRKLEGISMGGKAERRAAAGGDGLGGQLREGGRIRRLRAVQPRADLALARAAARAATTH
jgi:hypothetical protein